MNQRGKAGGSLAAPEIALWRDRPFLLFWTGRDLDLRHDDQRRSPAFSGLKPQAVTAVWPRSTLCSSL